MDFSTETDLEIRIFSSRIQVKVILEHQPSRRRRRARTTWKVESSLACSRTFLSFIEGCQPRRITCTSMNLIMDVRVRLSALRGPLRVTPSNV